MNHCCYYIYNEHTCAVVCPLQNVALDRSVVIRYVKNHRSPKTAAGELRNAGLADYPISGPTLDAAHARLVRFATHGEYCAGVSHAHCHPVVGAPNVINADDLEAEVTSPPPATEVEHLYGIRVEEKAVLGRCRHGYTVCHICDMEDTQRSKSEAMLLNAVRRGNFDRIAAQQEMDKANKIRLLFNSMDQYLATLESLGMSRDEALKRLKTRL